MRTSMSRCSTSRQDSSSIPVPATGTTPWSMCWSGGAPTCRADRPKADPASCIASTAIRPGCSSSPRATWRTDGCPIVGDRAYTFGGSRRVTPSARNEAERLEALAPRQLLHAAALSFTHPVTGVPLALTSEWPDDLRPALADAAADANLLAERNPLQYLGFFASDE